MVEENEESFTGNLVWTEQDRLRYFEWASKIFPLPDEPLLAIEVDATTEKVVEEKITHNGLLKRVLIRFISGHIALVSVMPYLNDKPLLEGEIVGDDQTFRFEQNIEFEKGSVAKVVIKNSDQVGHIPGIRFFTEIKE